MPSISRACLTIFRRKCEGFRFLPHRSGRHDALAEVAVLGVAWDAGKEHNVKGRPFPTCHVGQPARRNGGIALAVDALPGETNDVSSAVV